MIRVLLVWCRLLSIEFHSVQDKNWTFSKNWDHYFCFNSDHFLEQVEYFWGSWGSSKKKLKSKIKWPNQINQGCLNPWYTLYKTCIFNIFSFLMKLCQSSGACRSDEGRCRLHDDGPEQHRSLLCRIWHLDPWRRSLLWRYQSWSSSLGTSGNVSTFYI